jgi:flagellar hook-associated protein 1 FlgK
MSDMLAIGQSGVRAYARALDTLADNVANAATPGHVRRTATLAPANQGGGKGPLELDPGGGSGVRLTAITRAIDLLQLDTLRRAEGDVAALDSSNRWLSGIEDAVTGPNALDAPLDALFSATSDLANDPTNLAIRETFLAAADTLADQFNRSAADLARLDEDLGAEANIEVRTLNDLSQALADINGRLRRASGGSAAAAALADDRDRTLSRMASITSIDVQLDGKGQATVRIPDSGGPLLVQASDAVSARVIPSAGGLELRLGPTGGDEPATLVSGSLAGLSAARSRLTETRGRLDALGERIATDMNRAHMQGVDEAGLDGEPLFDTRRPLVTPARANGGTARIDSSLSVAAAIVPMTLVFNGTDWTLSRDDLLGSVTGQLPLTLDGLSVDGPGTPRAGDVFRIDGAGGAAAIALRPLTAAKVAAAQRWVAEPAAANLGSATVELRSGPALVPAATGPFTLTSNAGVLTLTDGLGTGLATGLPGEWIAGDGFSVRLTGSATDLDSFAIARNGPRSGGNGNAINMLLIRDGSGSDGTPGEQADALVSTIAVALRASEDRFAIARESRNQAAESLTLTSGVDLDAEAAEMLRLQQAYNANARVLQAAREIFETLLSSSR